MECERWFRCRRLRRSFLIMWRRSLLIIEDIGWNRTRSGNFHHHVVGNFLVPAHLPHTARKFVGIDQIMRAEKAEAFGMVQHTFAGTASSPDFFWGCPEVPNWVDAVYREGQELRVAFSVE